MSLHRIRRCLILGVGMVAAALAAAEQESNPAGVPAPAAQDAATGQVAAPAASGELEEITVTAHPLSDDGLSEAATVLTGDALERAAAVNIGETVARQAGVHSASFGAAVGRPVIHGMGGPRVRIMEDRIDAMDVSASSGDHAVTVEPYLAERVEILRGPSALLYGSGAIGGVVEVSTGRIPTAVPETVAGRLTARAAENGSAKNFAGRVDGGSGAFAWHVDAFRRTAGDYDIPGYAESARRRAEEHDEDHDEEEGHDDDEAEEHHEEDEHEDEHEEEAEAYGVLPNSASDGSGGSVGFSWHGARGFAGVSVSRLSYDYGLPGHAHGHDEHDEEEDDHHGEEEDDHAEEEDHQDEDDHAEEEATLDLDQTRIDFMASLDRPLPAFDRLNVRVGHNSYAHVELENGGVGTRFENKSLEGRLELVHDAAQGWRGALGAQLHSRDFSAIGEEAFVPPVDTSGAGLFWAGERPLGAMDLEAGLRLERVRHAPTQGAARGFTVFSGSAGIVSRRGAIAIGANASYSGRAPSPEALYSNGPHLATGSFEVGDPMLDAERSLHVAATAAWRGERAGVEATAYSTTFRDHILAFATGEEEDELPVWRYGQADASYRGLDLTARGTVVDYPRGAFAVSATFDTVFANIDRATGDRNVPRLPPRRFGLGLHWEHRSLNVDLEWTRMAAQERTGAFELPTDSYEDVRLDIGLDLPLPNGREARVFVQGRNLTDADQRQHSSIIKDVAPLPGRTIEFGARFGF